MVGGRQLKSRRNKARRILGKDITLMVSNDSWENEFRNLSIKGTFVFLTPDKGYFLKGTNAKIPLPHAKIFYRDKLVKLDLSNSYIQSPQNYLEARA